MTSHQYEDFTIIWDEITNYQECRYPFGANNYKIT